MKAIVTMLFFSFSVSAHAQEIQVKHCGDTLRQVANIVNQQFGKLDSGNIVACFKGNWGYGVVIEVDKPLNFGGYDFEACPQSNGRIYLHKKNDPSDGGLLKCSAAKLSASGFTGALAVANGNYPRKNSQLAKADKDRN